ncbi:hypothetical protein GW17_00006677, partial [Ensete ventricosum]
MLFSDTRRCRGAMERAMKISDDAWASSLAAPTPAAGGDRQGPRFAMNQSPLEWQLENVVAAPTSPTIPSPTPDHIPKSVSRGPPSDPRGGAVDDCEMMEIEAPVSVDAQRSNPFAGVDPQEYASLLKRNLDLYCAAVALSRVSQLRVENSSLLKCITNMNQKYNEAAADNRVLKADVETLRARVKMAEDTFCRVTGKSPPFGQALSPISTINVPCTRNSSSDATSDTAVVIQDDSIHLSQATAHNKKSNTCLLELASAPLIKDVTHGTAARGKRNRAASMKRVASLESLQNRICNGRGPCMPVQVDAAAWDPEATLDNKNQEQQSSGTAGHNAI